MSHVRCPECGHEFEPAADPVQTRLGEPGPIDAPVEGAFSFVRSNQGDRGWMVCGPAGAAWRKVKVRRKWGEYCVRALGPEVRKMANGKAIYSINASFNQDVYSPSAKAIPVEGMRDHQ